MVLTAVGSRLENRKIAVFRLADFARFAYWPSRLYEVSAARNVIFYTYKMADGRHFENCERFQRNFDTILAILFNKTAKKISKTSLS